MTLLGAIWTYLVENSARFWQALGTHLALSGGALLIALLVAVPLGVGTSRWGGAGRVVLNAVGVARVVPSIAVLLLLLPILGTGFPPSLVALTLLAAPPILLNTDAGLRAIDPAILEAGRGMGYPPLRLLREVQLPLALPVLLAGVRTAAVEVIASATLATFIGGGGLGQFIVSGLALSNNAILLAGAIPIAALALLVETLLAALQRTATRRTATT
ncbi:MAG: ABC transporter permease [Chloroflexota bacterium]|nr:ABC transporter permease [Chloroflexota bacterium]